LSWSSVSGVAWSVMLDALSEMSASLKLGGRGRRKLLLFSL
jgi:hypothetical protein